MFCDGGLFSCTRCGGFEGTLPSQCPGEKMTSEQETGVYAGRLDFREGAWVNAPSGSVSSHYDGRPGLPSASNPAVIPEPPPVRTDSLAVWPLVIADLPERLCGAPPGLLTRLAVDMAARNVEGTRKYGTPLQVENGRNPTVDAYQEALDLCVYARQRYERTPSSVWQRIYEDAVHLAALICSQVTTEETRR